MRRIQLPTGVAVWVLGAHLYALLIPLALFVVIQQQTEQLLVRADYPWVFYVAILLMILGSAFEIVQNHLDHWYLTAETPSANGVSICDMLFYFFVVASQAAVVIACMGKTMWLTVLVVMLALSQPLFYRAQKAAMLPLALLGLLSAIVAFNTFGDPVILLQIGLPVITMFFFGLLLKTGSQILHGFTTLAASSGVLLLAWGIHRAGTLPLDGWLVFTALVIAALVITRGLRRLLSSLPATVRP